MGRISSKVKNFTGQEIVLDEEKPVKKKYESSQKKESRVLEAFKNSYSWKRGTRVYMIEVKLCNGLIVDYVGDNTHTQDDTFEYLLTFPKRHDPKMDKPVFQVNFKDIP